MTAAVTPLKQRAAAAVPVWLSPEQVCERVPGMTVRNLEELRAKGRGPKYHKPTGPTGRVVVYEQSDVDAWVSASVVTTRDSI